MNFQQTTMRTFKSFTFHLQFFRRSLVIDRRLRQAHLYCTVLNEKYSHNSGWVKGSLASGKCSDVKFMKYYHCDPSLKNAKEFSTSGTAMAKDRGQKDKKRNVQKKIDEEEIALLISVEQLKKQLDRAVEGLKNDYIRFVSLRSVAGTLEQLPIYYKEQTYVLQEIAQISRKPNLVVINVDAFPDATPAIVNSLKKSNMNLSPQQEGTTLYVKIPKVTKDHREGLAKSAKSYMIKCKDNIKDVRNKYAKQIKSLEKQPKDLVHRVLEGLDGIIDQYNKEAEKVYNTKQQELLGE